MRDRLGEYLRELNAKPALEPKLVEHPTGREIFVTYFKEHRMPISI